MNHRASLLMMVLVFMTMSTVFAITCNPNFKANLADTECFYCPCVGCIACSANLVCEQFNYADPVVCDNSTQKWDASGCTCYNCAVDNCTTCMSTNICSSCKKGLELNTLTFPYTCDTTPKKRAITCNFRFTRFCSSCQVDTKTSQPECAECKNSQFGMKPSPDHRACILCRIDNCLHCDSVNRCKICYDGYGLDTQTNTCVKNIA